MGLFTFHLICLEKYRNYIDEIQDLLFCLNSMNSFDDVIILGDFNLAGYNWKNNLIHSYTQGYNDSANIRDTIKLFTEFCEIYKIFQLNNFKNSFDNILDLVFSNNSCISVTLADDYFFDNTKFHLALTISIPIKFQKKLECEEVYYDFNNCDYSQILNKLINIDWDSKFSMNNNYIDTDNIVDRFNDILINLINDYVPKIKKKKSKYPIWFSKELIRNIIEKKKNHKFFKIFKTKFYKDLFSDYRINCIKLSRKDKLNYINRVENSINNKNSKYFFKYISEINNKSGFPNVLHYNNETANNGSDIVNLFVKKFGNVYRNFNLNNTNIPFDFQNSFNQIVIYDNDVINAIKDLNINSSPGPDGIHPKFIKECMVGLVQPLVKIFNYSLSCGTFPNAWKSSYITPIYKSGDRSNVDNYRPINKLSLFPKLFDSIVHKKISFIFLI